MVYPTNKIFSFQNPPSVFLCEHYKNTTSFFVVVNTTASLLWLRRNIQSSNPMCDSVCAQWGLFGAMALREEEEPVRKEIKKLRIEVEAATGFRFLVKIQSWCWKDKSMWWNCEKREESKERSEWGDYGRRSLRFALSHERGVKIDIRLGVRF